MPTAEVNGQRISYRDTGGDLPVLVFSHGYLMNGEMFTAQVDALSEEFRCIVWDERGHGKTGPATAPFDYYDSAADLVALLDHLGVDRAVFVGMSQGGYLTLRLALGRPDLVAGIVLLGSQAAVETPHERAAYDELSRQWQAGGATDEVIDAVASIILDPAWPGSQQWAQSWRSQTPANIGFIYGCLGGRDDITHRLPEITAPTLVIWGDADAAMKRDNQDALIAGLQRASFVEIDGATHIVNMTHPDVVNKHIAEFARTVVNREAFVLLDVTDGVATLTLNRPEKLNALHEAMLAQLHRLVDEIATRDDIHVVVLTGAGKSFCAGHDLAVLAGGDAKDARYVEGNAIDALERLAVPTIAKVRGHCLTGGLELALGCDLIVASDSAKLGDTHSQWGLVPVWGMTVRLPERVGRSKAKEMSFTSRRISGTEAEKIGLVDYAVPELELDTRVAALASEIARNSPGSNSIMKKLYADSENLARPQGLKSERDIPYGLPPDMFERLTAPKGGVR